MKYFAVFAVVGALLWFAFDRFAAGSRGVADSAPVPAVAAPPAQPAASVAAPAAAAPPLPVAAPPVPVAVEAAPTPAPAPSPAQPIKIDLAQVLGPDNHYHDAAVGVSVLLPEGWKVRSANRWGKDNTENTVFMKPDGQTTASPSMYYKPYTAEEAGALGSAGAERLFREQAQKKEASRIPRLAEYRNVPDSFSFFEVNGSPAMSYFATFTERDQVMTEHFIRILGPRGYVMFFTTGKFEDVKAIIPQLRQAAATVKGP